MPTPGGIDVNMNGAQLAAYELPLVDEARRPQASCDRGLFEEADFDVGGDERFVLDGGRFHHPEPLRFIYLLALSTHARKFTPIDAPKPPPLVQLYPLPAPLLSPS